MVPQGITTCSRLMAHPSPIVRQPPAAVQQELIRMGRDIRTARLGCAATGDWKTWLPAWG